jgi:hypothetical protein
MECKMYTRHCVRNIVLHLLREVASSQHTYSVKFANGDDLINLHYSIIHYCCTHMLRLDINTVRIRGSIPFFYIYTKYHPISSLWQMLISSTKYTRTIAFLKQTNSL